MSFGEVDTLGMLFDKLQSLFDESQGYYESFLDTNNMYKKGQISDKEFFQKLGDYTVAYSALEFLAIKVIFELKKSQGSGGSANTQSPGLMPGMGQPGMMAGGMNPTTKIWNRRESCWWKSTRNCICTRSIWMMLELYHHLIHL